MRLLISTAFAVVVLVMGATGATAGVIYTVNRAWTNGSTDASLVGTVDVDLGNYAIQNNGPAPFNAVNLVLTVGGTSFNVNNVLTDIIAGTGVFSIQATATQLIFNPVGDGINPADLVFSDGVLTANRYVIGSDGDPAFEVAQPVVGGSVAAVPGPVYPVVWATVRNVPEPATLALFGLGILGLGFAARQRKTR